MNKNLLIIGAGQYGSVAYEVADAMKCFDKIDFLDDNSNKAIGKLCNYKTFVKDYAYAFVAVGNPQFRLDWIAKLKAAQYEIATLIDPKACISPTARVMEGSIVEPMAVVQANTTVSLGCLVCSGAVVKHNSVVEEGCYLDCTSVVMANTTVSAMTKVESKTVFK